ncbi:hypothetical protein TRFO_36644 [Tritrichomonas foetus]|uniref:Uncharacterized protein n=1 Tax=Tritrichomonas foetus TaxID=1144522 RepID=A0A1J4JDF3_9EUKA|nr:hypothetical protein TRFO_36644 [Tritrichomonas foetus]|eukprot:OHS97186.1 hypothetical protein TRFO_36644 [Tritrichomonas foetus]
MSSRTPSQSSSRSSTPSSISKRHLHPNYKDPLYILECAIIILSSAILVSSPVVTLSMLKLKHQRDALNATFINAILLHFCAIVRTLLKKENRNFKALWYDIHFHYLLNDLTIYLVGLDPIAFYLSVGSRSLFIVFKALDDLFTLKGGPFSELILSFTKPALESVHLHQFSAFMEIAVFPYLIVYSIFSFRLKVLIACLINFNLFILMAYRTDESHQYVWRSIHKFAVDVALHHLDEFGGLLYKIIEMCEKLGKLGNILYPM